MVLFICIQIYIYKEYLGIIIKNLDFSLGYWKKISSGVFDMDTDKNFIILKNKIRTEEVESCKKINSDYYLVKFRNSDQLYTYRIENVIWLTNSTYRDPSFNKLFSTKTLKPQENIKDIREFSDTTHKYWHVKYENGIKRDFDDHQMVLVHSVLANKKSSDCLKYLRESTEFNPLISESGRKLLRSKFEYISDFIPDTTVLAKYLNPTLTQTKEASTAKETEPIPLIFPFAFNASQYEAVKNAMTKQISIIQGPPGTGKTQTILNIIANYLIQGKNILVVSSNNAALSNIQDKLKEVNLEFVAAFLGKKENTDEFFNSFNSFYIPELKPCVSPNNDKTIQNLESKLKTVFQLEEVLSSQREEYEHLNIEYSHFSREFTKYIYPCLSDNSHPSSVFFKALYDLEHLSNNNFWDYIRLWLSLLCIKYKTGIKGISVFPHKITQSIFYLKYGFYQAKNNELYSNIIEIKQFLEKLHSEHLKQAMQSESLSKLNDFLYKKYSEKIHSTASHLSKDTANTHLFQEKDLWKNPGKFINRFPVILSTNFSSKTSLNPNFLYDCVIMDEASQASIEEGALTLSCAHNAVIVGDSFQLTDIRTTENKVQLSELLKKYSIDSNYDGRIYSFLDSIQKVIPSIPVTMLKEHYRCHPKIINFCNQKFYGGRLRIMTEDHNESDVLSVYQSTPGNHARGRCNMRDADIIADEILPNLPKDESIGIIAPYNDQVKLLKKLLPSNVEVSTIHKYQGRQKDIIIFDVTTNKITPFADDSRLINVAVSRAIKKLYLITSPGLRQKGSNISDLLDYISYTNGNIVQSNTYSIFDLLYSVNTQKRINFLKNAPSISPYYSENLTYVLLKNILDDYHLQFLGILCHYPLNQLIRNKSKLSSEEKHFVSNAFSHVDFLIFNKVSKLPLMVIEVDGPSHNKADQKKRDSIKDHVLKQFGIPCLRLKTTGSRETYHIIQELQKIYPAYITHPYQGDSSNSSQFPKSGSTKNSSRFTGYPQHLRGNSDYILVYGQMGYAFYLLKSSVMIERCSDKEVVLSATEVGVSRADEGYTEIYSRHTIKFRYTFHPPKMYISVNGKWKCIPREGCSAEVSPTKTGIEMFKAIYGKDFYKDIY